MVPLCVICCEILKNVARIHDNFVRKHDTVWLIWSIRIKNLLKHNNIKFTLYFDGYKIIMLVHYIAKIMVDMANVYYHVNLAF